MGMKWSCSETKFYAEPGWGEVHQYFLESSLTAELEAVADTFLGVDGMFLWEAYEHMHHKHVESYGSDYTCRSKDNIPKDAESEWREGSRAKNWVKVGVSQKHRLLSCLGKLLPQRKVSAQHSVELIEFGKHLGVDNEHRMRLIRPIGPCKAHESMPISATPCPGNC